MAGKRNFKQRVDAAVASFKEGQVKGAQNATMEELFNDYYAHRHQVYLMNFVRGVFFGLGSVLGGTIVVGLIIWILSFFVNFPVIGQYFDNASDRINKSQEQ